jgi:outer membrane immunogenic protein
MSKMRKMRSKWSAVAITAVAVAGVEGAAIFPAFAADMAPVYTKEPVVAPVASWTGFYLGGGIGFRSANVSEQTLSANLVNPVRSVMDPVTCSFTSCGTTSSLDHTAFRFNPYLGYNWQLTRQWLVGLEGDVGFGSKTSSIDGVPLPGAGQFSDFNSPGDSFAVKTGWDASARARVGYLATPDLLVYATGGAAWQHVEATSTCGPHNLLFTCSPLANNPLNPNNPPFLLNPATVTDSATKLGYTIGGGVETMVDGHWLVRAEFRYSDFGSITNTDARTAPVASADFTTSYRLRLTTETALVGVAYKF